MSANKIVAPSLIAALALLLTGLVACESGTETEVPEASSTPQFDGSSERRDAAGEREPRRAVLSDELPYAEINEELVYGHFVFPSDMIDPLPAVCSSFPSLPCCLKSVPGSGRPRAIRPKRVS